jgi:hypothetical protein
VEGLLTVRLPSKRQWRAEESPATPARGADKKHAREGSFPEQKRYPHGLKRRGNSRFFDEVRVQLRREAAKFFSRTFWKRAAKLRVPEKVQANAGCPLA